MKTNIVDSQIIDLISKGKIKSPFISYTQDYDIQPATLDLRATNKAYVLESKEKLPQNGVNIEEKVKDVAVEEIDISNGFKFEKNVKYAIPVLQVNLPNYLTVEASAKSTVGRNSLHVRTAFDNHADYESIPAGGKGTLWLEIMPQAWNIFFGAGQPLNQLQFIDKRYSDFDNSNLEEEQLLFDNEGKPIKYELDGNRLPISINLKYPKEGTDIIGYESKITNKTCYLNGKNNISDFWNEIKTNDQNQVELKPGRIYIFGSNENLRIPGMYTAQMMPYNKNHGQFETNIAGLFDSLFGGDKGCTAVYELRTFGDGVYSHGDRIFRHAELMCQMELFRNSKLPDRLYGDAGNTYQMQKGPRLAKNFVEEVQQQLSKQVPLF